MFDVRDIISDWGKVGTMFIVSRWLSGESLTDIAWRMSVLYTLLGFTTYFLSTKQIIDTSFAGEYKSAADDCLYFGTMLVVSRLLSGGSFFDATWLYTSISVLVSVMIYYMFVAKYIQGRELTYHKRLQNTIDTQAKFGTMLVAERLLSCESIFNPAWGISTIATLFGYATYDMVTSRVTDKINATI